MPDVSILQNDFGVEVKESKIPGFFLTISIIFLIVSVGSYIGLLFYKKALDENLSQVEKTIEGLNIEGTSSKVAVLNKVEDKLNILKELRAKHTDAGAILDVIAKTVHPLIYYLNADVNLSKGLVFLTGMATSPASVAEQILIYSNNESISEYSIEDVAIVGSDIKFSVLLKVKN